MTTQVQIQLKKELKKELESPEFQARLAKLKVLQPERFVVMTFQALRRNPKLVNCTQASFLGCLLDLAAMGLEPDGRNAHLIPFGDVCTLIIDYKGIKQLLHRNKDVIELHADVVGYNDYFDVQHGTSRHLDHKPCVKERGEIYAVYCYAKLPGGGEEYELMSVAEVEAVRRRSKTPNAGPWVTDWSEMAKKTVFRRQAKGLPLSPETQDALARESDGDTLLESERVAVERPVAAAVVASSPKKASEPAEPAEPAQAPSSKEELARKVRELLAGSAYSEADLLSVMKARNMARADAIRLEDCAIHHLQSCITDWDAALDLLKGQFDQPPFEEIPPAGELFDDK